MAARLDAVEPESVLMSISFYVSVLTIHTQSFRCCWKEDPHVAPDVPKILSFSQPNVGRLSLFSDPPYNKTSDDRPYHRILELLPLEGHAALFFLSQLPLSLERCRQRFQVLAPKQRSVDLTSG